MNISNPMRHAALRAGFRFNRHALGFTGVLNAGPGAPLLLLVWNTGDFSIAGGDDISSPLRCGRGYAGMIKAIRAAQARSRESAGEPQVDDRHLLDGVAGATIWSAAAD